MMDLLEQIKYEAICLLIEVLMLMFACKIQTRHVPTEGEVLFKHDAGFYEKMNTEFDKLLLR